MKIRIMLFLCIAIFVVESPIWAEDENADSSNEQLLDISEEQCLELTIGVPTAGQIESPSDILCYKITVTGTEPLFVHLDKASGWNGRIAVYRGSLNGERVGVNDSPYDQMLQIDDVEPEIYYVTVQGNVTSPVTYTLIARRSLDELVINTPEQGQITHRYGVSWYQVEVTGTEPLFVHLDKDIGWNGHISVYKGSLNGELVGVGNSPYDQMVQVDDVEPDTYYVVIWQYSTWSVNYTLTVRRSLDELVMDIPLPGQIPHRYAASWHQVELDTASPLVIIVETTANCRVELRIKKDVIPNEPPYWHVSGTGHLEVGLLVAEAGTYYIQILCTAGGGEYTIEATTDINKATKPLILDNEVIAARVSAARACVTSLVFKPGTNQELIHASKDRYLIDFGSQDPELKQYFKTGWQAQVLGWSTNHVQLQFTHSSGFENQLSLVWDPGHVEVRAYIVAPEPVEIDNNIAPGEGFHSGADKWAVPAMTGVQTGSFTYPGSEAWIYPSSNPDDWIAPSGGWMAFWNDDADEVHGFTFSEGYKLQVANSDVTDLHFMIPAGMSQISFQLFKPKPVIPYEAIELASGPYFSLTNEVDKLFAGVGAELYYTLGYGNTGAGDATEVVLENVLPSEFEVDEASISDGGFYDPIGHSIIWNIPALPAGSEMQTVTFMARIAGGVSNGTRIVNVARIRSAEEPIATVVEAVTTVGGPEIISISPDRGGNAGSVTLNIVGKYLDLNAKVRLVGLDGMSFGAHIVEGSNDGNNLSAVFHLEGKAPKTYDIVVVNPDNNFARVANAFTIESGGQPNLWLDIVGNNRLRLGRYQTYIINYGNSGTVDAFAAVILIHFPTGMNVKSEVIKLTGVLGDILQEPNGYILAIILPVIPVGFSDQIAIKLRMDTPASNIFIHGGITIEPELFMEVHSRIASIAHLGSQRGHQPGIQNIDMANSRYVSAIEFKYAWNAPWTDRPAGYHDVFWVNVIKNGKPVGGFWESGTSLGGGSKASLVGRKGVFMFPFPVKDKTIPVYEYDLDVLIDSGISFRDQNGDFWTYQFDHVVCIRPKKDWTSDDASQVIERYESEYKGKKFWFCSNEKRESCENCDRYGIPCKSCIGLYDDLVYQRKIPMGERDNDEDYGDTFDFLRYQFRQNYGAVWPWYWLIFYESAIYGKIAFDWHLRIDTVSSLSPEDKYGPAGYDSQDTEPGQLSRFVRGDKPFEYRIDFWNKEDAPVPTQDVFIEDQLDSNLDWDSFEFRDFGFLKWNITVPPGKKELDETIDLRPDMSLLVRVQANIDSGGVVRWTFNSIDPYTGEPPEDPDAGFLPPITESGYEIGWVNFIAEPNDGLTTGDQISNQAFVKFDVGPWKPAPPNPDSEIPGYGPWINTIDSGAPTSHVKPLPEDSSSTFTVEWEGTDDEGGSGVGCYTIYASEDGINFDQWLFRTSDTSAQFTGERDHTYYFYSRAEDNVGNVEEPPQAPDAFTKVTVPHWTLISIPYLLADNSLNKVLESIEGHYSSVWSYVASTKEWKRYFVNGPVFINNLYTIEAGKGYYIEMFDSTPLNVVGNDVADDPIDLLDDWNLVGYNSLESKSCAEALASISGFYDSVWSYNHADGGWDKYVAGWPEEENDLETMDPWKGYWIDANTPCSWDVNDMSTQAAPSVAGRANRRQVARNRPQLPYTIWGSIEADGMEITRKRDCTVILKINDKVHNRYKLGTLEQYGDYYVIDVPEDTDNSAQIELYVKIDADTVKAANVPWAEAGRAIQFDLSVDMIPETSMLRQNYPNPFNPDTWIPYQLSEDSHVEIRIFSVTGQLVRKLDLGRRPAGFYTSKEKAAYWDGRNEAGESVASGVYFYSIKAGGLMTTRKMVIAK